MLHLLLACRPSVEPKGAVDTPTPDQLLALYDEARGAETLRERSSVQVEGVVISSGAEALFTEVATREGQYRLETQVKGRPFVVGCDGQSGWTWQGVGPAVMEPAEQRAACVSVHLWGGLEGDLRVVGAERVAAHDAWRVDIEEPGQPARSAWFDQTTHLMVARSWRVSGVVVQEQLLDWRDYEGVMLPTTVVAPQSGLTFEKRSVAWDVEELPDFQMPDVY